MAQQPPLTLNTLNQPGHIPSGVSLSPDIDRQNGGENRVSLTISEPRILNDLRDVMLFHGRH
ncbi:hypothetical protein [Sinosporangium siamense]|uniref:Uncharacterized protein n=1 Tax=Sinosporangium siamense TaxID=1367973 RepID=A0A919RL30_9ACTN|nr:hypothetical protein [Sinosporangium siamense]GII95800.1 hypothetical protein Ssi02_60310 [Sinosporangium siamense]